MSFIKLALVAVAGPLTYMGADVIYHKDYYVEKYMKKKCTFVEALEALKSDFSV